jgi:autotransporter-associated beta strand protein
MPGWCRLLWIGAALYIALAPRALLGADKIWTGGTDTVWSTNGNWTGNHPAAGDNAIFSGAFTNQPNITSATAITGIYMTTGVAQNVTVSGSALTLNGGTVPSGGTAGLGILVDNTSAFTLTFSAPLKVGNAQIWRNSSGNLLTVGAVDTNGKALTIDGIGNTTVGGVVSNTGSITMAGSGILTLSNTNTYTGGTTINSGTVVVNSAASLGATGGGAALNAGTVEVSTGFSTSRVYTLGNAASTFNIDSSQTLTVTSAIGGALGTLNKTGTGTMVLSGSNTYLGGTNINAGTLQVNNSGALSTAGTISFGGGTLQYTASNTTDYSARFSVAASQAYRIDTNGQNVTLATALISSGGSMTKSGTGTLTLTGTNTFNGTATVNGGTLLAAGTVGSALGSTSGITVNSGGTLQLGASNQINNSATMALAGGTFAKGTFAEGTASAVGIGTLTLSAAGSHIDFGTGTVGILTFASLNPASFTLVIDNWTGTVNTVGTGSTDRLIFDSDQASNLSAFSFTGFGVGAKEFNLGGGFWEVVAVPEPSSWVSPTLAAVALGGLHFQQRRRRKCRVARAKASPPGPRS